ncbi:MAG: hypothetical protein ACTSR8_06760 [Promethearchaeota archaeon]
MDQLDSILITTTLHEPEFRLKENIEKALPFIREHIGNIIISCTSETHGNVLSFLEQNGFKVSLSDNDDRIATYLNAIKLAISEIKDRDSQRILYIDFDRLIHWINNYPEELKKTFEEAAKNELLHIGRTPNAFKTHPNTQTDTEHIVNYLGSQALSLNKVQDLISVCYSFTFSLADLILNKKYFTEMGFYIAWPVILWDHAQNKKYIEVEGLEWETPDRFTEEINQLGYSKWLEQFQTAEEWKKRVRLLDECVVELNKLINP